MVKLIIDSASDLTKEEADELNVILMPMEVKFPDGEYLDGVNLSHRRFFEMLIESDDLPKTSQINEFRFEECFSSVEGEAVVITISSKLSGTYNCAKQAASKYDKIHVVDSLNACIGERLLLMYALDLKNSGLFGAEIAALLDKRKHDIKLLALLDTLRYLQKGGRISKATAFAGELLNVKPVIAIEDGEVKLVGKALGSRKGNNLLNRLVQSCGGINFDMPYAVAYSGLDDSMLKKYIEDSAALYRDHTDSIPSYMIGSTIGTHAGPGAIAVSFFAGETK